MTLVDRPSKHAGVPELHQMSLVIAHRDVRVLAKKVFDEIFADNLFGLSSEAAYSFFFGLFPTFLFAAPILALFGQKQRVFDQIMSRLAPALPADAYTLVSGVLHDVIFAKNAPALISVGGILALYGGAGMFSSLMSALNGAYDVADSRSWWRQKLIAIAATVVAAIAMGSVTTIFLGGEQLLELVVRALQLGTVGTVLGAIFQYSLALALLVVSFWAMYMILPDVRVSKTHALIGAIFASAFWIAFTTLFRVYVVNFGSYNKTYGTIGAVIVLLTWMYWTMFAVLVGGELNSELHLGTGLVASDSTSSAGGRLSTHSGLPHSSAEID